jgi:D-arabinose 1-dehydrogenase-like Zn-dependent alcohol dehydrogenase
MKAAIFEKLGLENLEIKQDAEEPKLTDHDVLIKVKMCGVNPIDHMVTSGAVLVKPVIVHSRVFDGTCDMCLEGLDMLCRNGGIVSAITNGGFAEYTWESSFESVGVNGKLVTFGGLTGADVKLNVQSLYLRQVKLIGSSRGTRGELKELITMSKELKTKVWKRFKLDETKEALQALFAKERDGRIMLEI